MQDLALGDLKVEVDITSPGTVRLDWMGRSNSREPGKILLPFFDDVLKHAVRERAMVEMHFEKLEHFNSSTIAAVIQLINSAQERKVPMKMHYDANLRWQALSFDALRRALKPFQSAHAAPIQFLQASAGRPA
jgi:hypothetical protein